MRRYDPGQPKAVHSEGNGRFTVQSFRDPSIQYRVNLAAQTCTCPHHTVRKAHCKHLSRAETESYAIAMSKARHLPFEELKRQSEREDLRPEVKAAIKYVMQCRGFEAFSS